MLLKASSLIFLPRSPQIGGDCLWESLQVLEIVVITCQDVFPPWLSWIDDDHELRIRSFKAFHGESVGDAWGSGDCAKSL